MCALVGSYQNLQKAHKRAYLTFATAILIILTQLPRDFEKEKACPFVYNV